MSNKPVNDSEDFEVIFVTCITLKNGKKIHAASYGKKAFPIRVRKK